MVGRSSGVVLMAPPTESAEAAASVSTLLSTLKPKQKVRHAPLLSDSSPAEDPLGSTLEQKPACNRLLRGGLSCWWRFAYLQCVGEVHQHPSPSC